MPISAHNLGERAIAKALNQFETPTSELFREIRTSLREIERDYFSIKNSFIQRAEDRRLKEEVSKETKLIKAKQALKEAMDNLTRIRETNQTDVIPLAESLVTFAEGEIALVESTSGFNAVLIDRENGIDEDLWKWYDQFISLVVEALEDDTKFHTAIEFLAGGTLLVGGMATSTLIGDIAGVLAAIQLAQNTLKNLKAFSSLDRKMKRYELGLQLIDAGRILSARWIAILAIKK